MATSEDRATAPHLLVVIDHQEARVYRTEVSGAVPERITPYDPHGYGRHLHTEALEFPLGGGQFPVSAMLRARFSAMVLRMPSSWVFILSASSSSCCGTELRNSVCAGSSKTNSPPSLPTRLPKAGVCAESEEMIGRGVGEQLGGGDEAVAVHVGLPLEPLQDRPGEDRVPPRPVVGHLLVGPAGGDHLAGLAAGDLLEVLARVGVPRRPAAHEREAAVAGVHDVEDVSNTNGRVVDRENRPSYRWQFWKQLLGIYRQNPSRLEFISYAAARVRIYLLSGGIFWSSGMADYPAASESLVPGTHAPN